MFSSFFFVESRAYVRLRLRRKAAAASRGSRKQGNIEGGRCGSKDGWGGWAALECAATAALDLQAGRVSKAKGVVMLRLAEEEGRGQRHLESVAGR
ncbi:hypothetical protein B296_00019819 [Ensete ventricosum]|uniref:Uncharacterized protein n=1 Tax=Ensete ventricosum TaxID=4639 RepID=A0A426YRZ5_ENSVE|nr:hypothetical protein B296_00019819 [Ensete ventricosum]